MAIDLEHVRRSRRLLELLVDRFGVAHFLEARESRVNARACDDAVALARTWIERRTGRKVSDEIGKMMKKDLSALLKKKIAEGAACVKR